jgi:pyridoxine/pyridoxamine 5'-phosphate oxidase
MTKSELFEFIRAHRYAVVSSVAAQGTPESAVVGFAVTPELEIIFDTVRSSRKYANLTGNPAAAVAMWTGEATAQYEGIASEPDGAERDHYREIYFETWPDGRERLSWAGITHFVIRPKWIRYSNFDTRVIEEFRF